MNLAVFPLLLPMMELRNGKFPEAIPLILKAIQTVKGHLQSKKKLSSNERA